MRRDARMLAALFERSMGLGEAWEVSETWSGEVFWFNKNCAEIALIFEQRTHRFLRSIRIA